MIATVQKWGNSLGVRLPKSIAQDSSIREGIAVDMTVQNGRVILSPTPKPTYQLGVLLKSVSAKNRHAEVCTGGAVGREAW